MLRTPTSGRRRGYVDREVWLKAGALGLIGWEMPEEYGGADLEDFRFNAILNEEYWATGTVGIGLGVQNDILAGYFRKLTTEEQKQRWLPKFVSGRVHHRHRHVRAGRRLRPREPEDHRHGGTATTTSSTAPRPSSATACSPTSWSSRAAPTRAPRRPTRGISLIVVETGTEGFTRGRKLDKIGQKAADTAELFFDNVRVPVENLIGEENRGFYHLMSNLPAERLGIAIHAVAQARRAIELTTEYARERKAFGNPIGTFQVNRHALAQMTIELDVMQTYVDTCILGVNSGELTADEAAGAKWWATETQWKIMDRCLQLHGGYGYMNEYEIARLWRDSRVQRIYGGTNEIMLDLVGRNLGF